MKRFVVVLMVLFVAGGVNAQSRLEFGGVYSAWAQSQHEFTFTPGAYNDQYVVQMLRLNLTFAANDYVRAVTRFDMAQGWWGVDNSLRSVQRTGSTGGSALFDFKDTNFLLHVDQAYVAFKVPHFPLTARAGRMWYGAGNRLVLDNNLDGIQLDLANSLAFGWAKVSEGVDGLSDYSNVAPDQRGFTDARDADLYSLTFTHQAGSLNYNAFAMYYNDASIGDANAYVPDHLQYFKTRFSPQVTRLTLFGLAGTYTADRWVINGEFDYLAGKDAINNTTYGANQMWDINNGNLSGYNLYLNAQYAPGDALSLGGVFGMGSGDPDKSGGRGNVNKLRTSGFFYLTEIWEDSIMPDEEGITPQGLGAPNIRGYRELENTTALQVNASLKLLKGLTGFTSYTFLRATQPVQAWGSNGSGGWQLLDKTATDLGQEIDFRLSYDLYDEVNLMLRSGYFMPGDAAAYLINGNNLNKENAWEFKGTITYRF